MALLLGSHVGPGPTWGSARARRSPAFPLNSHVTTQPVTAQSSPEPSSVAVPWVDVLSFPWALFSLLKWGQ